MCPDQNVAQLLKSKSDDALAKKASPLSVARLSVVIGEEGWRVRSVIALWVYVE